MNPFAELISLIFVGKLLIYLWMEFPLPDWRIFDNQYVRGWHTCDLCGGVVIYTILFWLYGVNILQMLGIGGIGLVGTFISGGAISFIVHLIGLGWSVKFNSVIVG